MKKFLFFFLLLPLQLFGQIHDLSSTSLDYTDTLGIAALGTTANSAPTVSNILINGTVASGDTVNVTYTYSDADGDSEGVTTFQWLEADDGSGTNAAQLSGETNDTLVVSDTSSYIAVEVTPVAATGESPGTADTSGWYEVTETNYALQIDDSTYISFSSSLVPTTYFAVSFMVKDYQEKDSPGRVFGSGARFNDQFALSEGGDLSWEDNGGNIYGNIAENNVKDSDWDTVRVLYKEDSIYIELNNYSEFERWAVSGSFGFDYFGSGADDVRDGADGQFDNLKVYDLTGYSNDWNFDTIESVLTPAHWFKFNEGSGSTIEDEYSAITGTINFNSVAGADSGSWVVMEQTAWNSQIINSSDGVHTDSRHAQTMVYDPYDNISYFTYMGTDGDIYVNSVDHDNSDAVGTPQEASTTGSYDSHSYPVIAMSDSGYVVVVHNDYANNIMKVARSTSARDITSWEVDTFAGTYYSGTMEFPEYPWLIKSRNGDIYLFHKQRSGNPSDQYQRWLYYLKSTDDGASWSADRIAAITRSTTADSANEVYIGQMTQAPYRFNTEERIWASWISTGYSSHDDDHDDLYAAYFVPDSAKWYGPDGTDLGVEITEAEQEGDSGDVKIYDGGDPGYFNTIYPDTTGAVIVSGEYEYSGGWSAISETGLGAESDRWRWWDGYWWAANSSNSYRSSDGETYESVESISRSGGHGYPYNSYVTTTNAPVHGNARAHGYESNTGDTDGTHWAIGARAGSEAEHLYIEAVDRTPSTSSSVTIRVYVMDQNNGAWSRDTDASTSIALAVHSGSGSVASSPISATNGLAEFTFNTPASAGETVLEATAAGLGAYRIHIYTQ